MGAPRTFKFTMGEVFPPDDPVARWLVTMSVGLNDVVFANRNFEKAEKGYENVYFFRLASAHLWELAKFINESHAAWKEVQEFVSGLSNEAQHQLDAIKEIATTGTVATVGTALVQIRDLFAHYQEMDPQARDTPRDPITKAMKALAEVEANVEVEEVVRDLRLAFADDVIDKAIIGLLPDEEIQRQVLGALGEALGHVVRFIQMALNAWLAPRITELKKVN